MTRFTIYTYLFKLIKLVEPAHNRTKEELKKGKL